MLKKLIFYIKKKKIYYNISYKNLGYLYKNSALFESNFTLLYSKKLTNKSYYLFYGFFNKNYIYILELLRIYMLYILNNRFRNTFTLLQSFFSYKIQWVLFSINLKKNIKKNIYNKITHYCFFKFIHSNLDKLF
jgi:hypothetical protein